MSIFNAIEEEILHNHKVLLIGLGCDVKAVYLYLSAKNISTDSLYSIDLICQGPTSPKVAKQFLDSLEKKYKSKVVGFNVRYKKYGWTPKILRVDFESGKKYERIFQDTDYGIAFNFFPRLICFSCKCKGLNHPGDITVGDHWGVPHSKPEYNEFGVSIAVINTQKGQELINTLDTSIFYLQKTNVETLLKNNLDYYVCRTKTRQYEEFEEIFNSKGLRYAVSNAIGIKQTLRRFLPPHIFVLKRFYEDKMSQVAKFMITKFNIGNFKKINGKDFSIMFNLKLTDDNEKVSNHQVTNYSISSKPTGTEQVTIGSQQVTYTKGELTLSFDCSDGHSITYVIHTDTREPDLNIIDTFVREEINGAVSNSWTLEITEYLERIYIYLGHETETQYSVKQFTAHKV